MHLIKNGELTTSSRADEVTEVEPVVEAQSLQQAETSQPSTASQNDVVPQTNSTELQGGEQSVSKIDILLEPHSDIQVIITNTKPLIKG